MAYTMAGSPYAPKYRTNRKGWSNTSPKTSVQPTIPAGFEQVHQDLMAYNGTFNLVLNIRNALMRWGKLTDKQWGAVKKCLAPQPVQDPSIILVDKCSIPIVVSTSAARHLAKVNKWPLNPCTLMVTQIKSQSKRSITVMVRMDWSSSIGVCRCCGKTLTDWKSQATGVGPYCVKRTNIQYVRNKADVDRFQNEMKDLCTKIGEVEVTLQRYHVKEGLRAIDALTANTSTTKTQNPTPTELVYPLQYCDWNEQQRTLTMQHTSCPAVNLLTESIVIHNPITNVRVKFIRQTHTISINVRYKFASSELDNPITLYINE